jgi:hypothetical protein
MRDYQHLSGGKQVSLASNREARDAFDAICSSGRLGFLLRAHSSLATSPAENNADGRNRIAPLVPCGPLKVTSFSTVCRVQPRGTTTTTMGESLGR